MRRAGAVALGVALTSTACLIAPNPKFIDDGGTAGETDGKAPDESPDETAVSCGDKVCELDGEPVQCVDGQCIGSLQLAIEHDTHVDADLPTANFGDEPTLRVDDARDAYILLPDLDGPGVNIESIELHLDCSVAGATIGVYKVGGNWTEQSVTHDSAPSIGGTELTSFTAIAGDNAVELVDLIQEWQLGNVKRGLGLRLLDDGDTEPNLCSSSEGIAPPYLAIHLVW